MQHCCPPPPTHTHETATPLTAMNLCQPKLEIASRNNDFLLLLLPEIVLKLVGTGLTS